MALIHVLDKQTDEIIATLDSEKGEILKALIFDSISNISYFDFTAAKKFDVLEKRNRVLVQNQDGHFNEFIITYAEQYKRNEKIIKADASYIDLNKAKVINPNVLTGATTSTAVTYALSGTEWSVGNVEFVNSRTITIEKHTDPYSLLLQIASTFGLEITYRVEVSGNKITGRYVDMKKQAAGFEGKEIVFGKDLIDVKRIEDSSNIVTALVGLGPEREGLPRLEAMVEDDAAFQRWHRKGRHLVQTYEPETSDQDMTYERLLTLTENELQKRIDAFVSYECTAASLEHIASRGHEKIRKGQTVRIKDEGYTPPLYLEARIDDVEIDPLSNKVLTFVIGSFKEFKKEDLQLSGVSQSIRMLASRTKAVEDALLDLILLGGM